MKLGCFLKGFLNVNKLLGAFGHRQNKLENRRCNKVVRLHKFSGGKHAHVGAGELEGFFFPNIWDAHGDKSIPSNLFFVKSFVKIREQALEHSFIGELPFPVPHILITAKREKTLINFLHFPVGANERLVRPKGCAGIIRMLRGHELGNAALDVRIEHGDRL